MVGCLKAVPSVLCPTRLCPPKSCRTSLTASTSNHNSTSMTSDPTHVPTHRHTVHPALHTQPQHNSLIPPSCLPPLSVLLCAADWMIADVLVKKSDVIKIHYDGWDKSFDEEIRKPHWSTRLAPLNTYTSPADGHDSCCCICKQGGKNLLMCESCPLVCHVECVGLRLVPSGKWYCQKCATQMQKDGRMSRGGELILRGVSRVKGRGRGGGRAGRPPPTSHLDAEVEEWTDAPPDPSIRASPVNGKENQDGRSSRGGRKRGTSAAGESGIGRGKHLAVKSGSPREFEAGEGVQGEEDGMDTDDDVRIEERKEQMPKGVKRARKDTPPAPSLFSRSTPLQFSSSSPSSSSSSPISTPSSRTSPTSISPPPSVIPLSKSTSNPQLVSGPPNAASTSSRKRVQVGVQSAKGKDDVNGHVAPTPAPAPTRPADSSHPSLQCLLDCYQFAYEKSREMFRATSSSSSPPTSTASGLPFPVSEQGTPVNIPALSFPPICLMGDHRQLLEDFCRFVDLDPSKPLMSIKGHAVGIDRWRLLMERLNEYRRFLQMKINQRMNSSNDERVELTKRRQMTESTYNEAKTRFRVEEDAEHQQMAFHKGSKRQLNALMEEKEAELRALRERMKTLEAEEEKIRASHQHALSEREETRKEWENRLRGIDEDCAKLTTLLNVLQALRDHVKDSKREGGESKRGDECTPWEPYHTVLTRLQKLEAVEAKRRERGSPSKAEQKEERKEEERGVERRREESKEKVEEAEEAEVVVVEFQEERKESFSSSFSHQDEFSPSPPHLSDILLLDNFRSVGEKKVPRRRPPTPCPRQRSDEKVEDEEDERKEGETVDQAFAHFEHKYDDGREGDGGEEEGSHALTQPLDVEMDSGSHFTPPISSTSPFPGLSSYSSPTSSLVSSLSSLSTGSSYPLQPPESVASTQTTLVLTQSQDGMRGWMGRAEDGGGSALDVIELDEGDDLPLTVVLQSAIIPAMEQQVGEKVRI